MANKALVVVHPKTAIAGPGSRLREQYGVIDAWKGPLFILDDERDTDQMTRAANTYIEIIDVQIDERESVGKTCRLDADDESGELEQAVERLIALHPEGEFLVTGAWTEDAVARVVRILVENDRVAEACESAISEEDRRT